MKQPWVAALYMRLSNDDGEPGDSGSIETQRRILHQYCEDNNITIYDEYVDAAVIIGLKTLRLKKRWKLGAF